MSEQPPGFGSTPPAPGANQGPLPDESQLPQARPLPPPHVRAGQPGQQGGQQQGGQPGQPTYIVLPSPKSHRGWMLLLGLLLAGSVVFNLVMLSVAVVALRGEEGWMGRVKTRQLAAGDKNSVVAVLPVYGAIDDSTADWLEQGLQSLGKDKKVKAVVLHVNSPGGTVDASDRIYHAITKFRSDSGKPVVIAQGGFATSGGYYVSAAGQYIVAEPTTWTGNIGVILPIVNAERGLKDKLGIDAQVIISPDTPFKDVPSFFRELKPQEREYLVSLVQSAYDGFVEVVAKGRKLKPEQVRKLADGKVYTAAEALRSKLVDQVGYLEDAWAKAAALAGVSSPKVLLYTPKPSTLGDVLFGRAPLPAPSARGAGLADLVENVSAQKVLYMYHGPLARSSWPTMDYSDPGQ